MDIGALRKAKDEFFARSHDSPLTHDQRHGFTGLQYFGEDPAYRFEVTLDRAQAGTVEDVELSDGSTRRMERAGHVTVRIGGRDVRLLAYEQGDELFVPFRDRTSGAETYGAGRYVEAEPLGEGRYLLDLNAAYNPYCAYNDAWRCPLPPRENWLDVEIRAGEKTFAH